MAIRIRLRNKLALLAIGCVAICFGLWIWPAEQLSGNVSIGFVGYTNSSGQTMALFLATNHNTRPIRYAVQVETKRDGAWPVYYGILPHAGYYDVPRSRDFQLLLRIPDGDAPWRVSLCYSVLDNWWGRARWRVAEIFYNRNLNKIGRIIDEGAKGCIVVGPEMTRSRREE